MFPEDRPFWTRRMTARWWAHNLVNRLAHRFRRSRRLWALNDRLARRWTEPYVAWRVERARANREAWEAADRRRGPR